MTSFIRSFIILFLAVFGTSSAFAHNSSWTRVDVHASEKKVLLTFYLNQRDLIQNVLRKEPFKRDGENWNEIQNSKSIIQFYLQSHVHLWLNGQPIDSGTLEHWPLTKTELVEDKVPVVLEWPLTNSVQTLEGSFDLYQEPDFSPYFEVFLGGGGGNQDIRHVGPNQKMSFIFLSSLSDQSEKSHPFLVVSRFLVLGFLHIIPEGLDHILFVLGLFLLNPRLKPLLLQVTAFTLAHSLTLALSLFGVFSLPGKIVEPLIAISIALVAIENIFQKEVRPGRWMVVFWFGLIHGLGFAGSLNEIHIPHDYLGWVVVSFNLGVELGQLSVITIAFLLTFSIRNYNWYPSWIRNPACILIAIIGFYWTVERVWLALRA